MAEKTGWKLRWEEWRPSKVAYFWSCVGCVVATIIVGFAWGGWVTGGTAAKMEASAASQARAQLAAAVCVDRFMKGADAQTRLASLKKTDSWSRDDVLEKGGWLAMAGQKEPVDGAADLCAEKLVSADLAPKASSS
jgi:hypothetical protein